MNVLTALVAWFRPSPVHGVQRLVLAERLHAIYDLLDEVCESRGVDNAARVRLRAAALEVAFLELEVTG